MSSQLNSLAWLAAWLLFGLLYVQALSHFMGVPWARSMTVIFYLGAMAWAASLTWRQRARMHMLNVIDGLFIAFVIAVLASLAFAGEPTGGVIKYAPYLPFMMIVPYVCGRLIRLPEIYVLLRIILIAGMVMLPLMLIDRLVSPSSEVGRWPFFGFDHGALMVGALLAMVLVALFVRVLDRPFTRTNNGVHRRYSNSGLLLLTTVFLVWTSARGWMLAGLAGTAIAGIAAAQYSILRRAALWVAVLGVAVLSLQMLPKIDTQFGRLYSKTFDVSSYPEFLLGKARPEFDNAQPVHGESQPILGEASCQPFIERNNSIAMRWLMYQEAIAMFLENPILGVGAGRFGVRSCAGYMGFPHSTILQGVAELGVIGGGLLIVLLLITLLTLIRIMVPMKTRANWQANAFALALFGAFMLADQIYGNYMMATGTWMLIGYAAGVRANGQAEGASRD